jgi:hypothetical protein
VYILPDLSHRAIRSEILDYNHKAYDKIKPYVFDPLPPAKKRIRLLQLNGDTLYCPSIYCELIEADYDNTFHIPTRAIDESSAAFQRYRSELQGIQGSKRRLKREYEWVQENRMKYEALSWCWGRDDPKHAVIINKAGTSYKMKVRKDLALALKYLRHPEKTRSVLIA